MKKLMYFSLVVATVVGGIFTVNSKTQNIEDVSASARVMANNGQCYNDAWDCLPTVVIIVKK
ncbi:MAG: hypothetical protein CVU03_11455 [Bacteroidetes bacterium HGW-Bacteroidetes-2]|jgi:hypothetical protein|nr:MAG: hypothetical protein CVU03_11455 [Bacteroidetes bacterium HGW-Bacteroidetes-2]